MEWEEWLQGPRNRTGRKFHPHTQKWHQTTEYYVPTSILGSRCTHVIFYCGIMPVVVQTMNYHVILLQEFKIIIKTLIIFKS